MRIELATQRASTVRTDIGMKGENKQRSQLTTVKLVRLGPANWPLTVSTCIVGFNINHSRSQHWRDANAPPRPRCQSWRLGYSTSRMYCTVHTEYGKDSRSVYRTVQWFSTRVAGTRYNAARLTLSPRSPNQNRAIALYGFPIPIYGTIP